MKAVVHKRFGPPEVQYVADVERPIPNDTEVLIKVHATTVNRTDCGFRKPEYVLVRFFSGFFRPRQPILGTELAGEIVEVGKQVTTFTTGEKVFGLSTFKFGAHAEYICMDESSSIAPMPVNMSYVQAAAVCDGLMLGMNIINAVDISRACRILVNGATGSIGSACVQLARDWGAEVTAVCKAESFDLVRSLGADHVIDYTSEDFTASGRVYDVVLDAVGKSSYFKCRKVLKPRGLYISTELGFLWQNVFLSLLTPLLPVRAVKFPVPRDSKNDIVHFKKLIEEGKYRAVIDRVCAFEEIVEATRYVESEQKVGNVVIAVVPPGE